MGDKEEEMVTNMFHVTSIDPPPSPQWYLHSAALSCENSEPALQLCDLLGGVVDHICLSVVDWVWDAGDGCWLLSCTGAGTVSYALMGCL